MSSEARGGQEGRHHYDGLGTPGDVEYTDAEIEECLLEMVEAGELEMGWDDEKGVPLFWLKGTLPSPQPAPAAVPSERTMPSRRGLRALSVTLAAVAAPVVLATAAAAQILDHDSDPQIVAPVLTASMNPHAQGHADAAPGPVATLPTPKPAAARPKGQPVVKRVPSATPTGKHRAPNQAATTDDHDHGHDHGHQFGRQGRSDLRGNPDQNQRGNRYGETGARVVPETTQELHDGGSSRSMGRHRGGRCASEEPAWGTWSTCADLGGHDEEGVDYPAVTTLNGFGTPGSEEIDRSGNGSHY